SSEDAIISRQAAKTAAVFHPPAVRVRASVSVHPRRFAVAAKSEFRLAHKQFMALGNKKSRWSRMPATNRRAHGQTALRGPKPGMLNLSRAPDRPMERKTRF